MRELRDRVWTEVSKVVVGQGDVVDLLLAAVAVNGHVLLEGVPGVGEDAAGQRHRPGAGRVVPPGAVHARHAPVRPHRAR